MKLLLVVAAICVLMNGGLSSGGSEQSAIQAVLNEHADAWTRGDAHAAAAVLTEDADWVSGSGRTFEGEKRLSKCTVICLRGQRRALVTCIQARQPFVL